MNLRPHRREQADINLTPLIDVVFLLLIFFMVSTTFKDETRLRVQLPRAEGDPAAVVEPAVIRVAIDRNGDSRVDGAAVGDPGTAALAAALTQASGADRSRSVLIQADAETPHRSVMQVLDAARRAGLVKIAFAAVRPPQAPAAEGLDRTIDGVPADPEVAPE